MDCAPAGEAARSLNRPAIVFSASSDGVTWTLHANTSFGRGKARSNAHGKEYVVDLGKFTVRATGPEEARRPHDTRARLCVSPRAVRVWPRGRP